MTDKRHWLLVFILIFLVIVHHLRRQAVERNASSRQAAREPIGTQALGAQMANEVNLINKAFALIEETNKSLQSTSWEKDEFKVAFDSKLAKLVGTNSTLYASILESLGANASIQSTVQGVKSLATTMTDNFGSPNDFAPTLKQGTQALDLIES
jgi:hypothetical protein